MFYTWQQISNRLRLEKADDLYYPTSELSSLFQENDDIHFVDLDGYRSLLNGSPNLGKLKEFLKVLGVRESVDDVINKSILPLYHRGEQVTPAKAQRHFKIFFDYYNSPDCRREFISNIKSIKFLCYRGSDAQLHLATADELYYPTQELKIIFEGDDDIHFVR